MMHLVQLIMGPLTAPQYHMITAHSSRYQLKVALLIHLPLAEITISRVMRH